MRKLGEHTSYIKIFLTLTGALFFITACTGTPGGSSVDVSELGVSMRLPAGWHTDRYDPGMFYEKGKKLDNFGMVEKYPLQDALQEQFLNGQAESCKGISATFQLYRNGYRRVQICNVRFYFFCVADPSGFSPVFHLMIY